MRIYFKKFYGRFLICGALSVILLFAAGCAQRAAEPPVSTPESTAPPVVITPGFSPDDLDLTDLEKSISHAVFTYNADRYLKGECAAEGHITLGKRTKNGLEVVYAIASYGEYNYQNGEFVQVSGSGAIPTVLVFKKNGSHKLLEYKEAADGARYAPTLKELFPAGEIREKALDPGQFEEELTAQKDRYVQAYLLSLNGEVTE
jgi:hypothetical protein